MVQLAPGLLWGKAFVKAKDKIHPIVSECRLLALYHAILFDAAHGAILPK